MKYPIDAHSKRLKESNEQLIEIQSQNTELLIENKKLKERILQLKECIEEYYSSGMMPDIR
jgi:regulator of replication initiation timing